MSYSQTITYDSASSLSFDDDFVQVSGGTVRLLDLGGGTYTLTPQLVTSQYRFALSSLATFTQSVTLPALTSVKYQLTLGDGIYWWSSVAGSWLPSDGSYEESSTAAEINTNASDLFTDLSILTQQFLGIRVWLATTSATVRPELANNAFTYGWVQTPVPSINECLITANLIDLLGMVPTYDAERPTKLLVSCDHAFLHGSRFVVPFTKEATFDSSGNAAISVIETTTPGVKLSLAVTYYDGYSRANCVFFNAIIPNEPTVGINSLATPFPYDFG